MIVEIGSMLSLNLGTKLYDILKEDDKVMYVFIETGRSEDLFEDKQFGEFGEAAILTVLVEENDQEEIFAKIYEKADLSKVDSGLLFTGQHIETYL
tara:strand:+ start:175 stop:462 length:288 start_codon:yes stop_codon:yes gene_type:complete